MVNKWTAAKNSHLSSDKNFWQLREIQNLVEVFEDVSYAIHRSVKDVALLDIRNGQPVMPDTLCMIPNKDLVLVIDGHSPELHVFESVDFIHSAVVLFQSQSLNRISVNAEEVIVSFSDGSICLFAVATLLNVIRKSKEANIDPLVQNLNFCEIEIREIVSKTLPFKSGMKANDGIIATRTESAELHGLVWTGQPAKFFKLVDDGSNGLELLPMELNVRSLPVGYVPNFSAGLYSESTKRAYFSDSGSAIVIELRFDTPESRLEIIAGNNKGSKSGQRKFGDVKSSTFSPLVSIAEYVVQRDHAEQLIYIFTAKKAAIDELLSLKQNKKFTIKGNSKRFINDSEKKGLLTQIPFLIAVERETGNIISISVPRSGNAKNEILSLLPESTRMVFPLFPFGTAFSSRKALDSSEKFKVTQGPKSSLIRYSFNSSILTIIESPLLQTAYSEDKRKAFITEQAKKQTSMYEQS